jgi:5'-deoxynucleotidase YfbR-like HD superfamily hydrolase
MEDEEIQKMTDINKLKEDKRMALEELDDAMNACSPEHIERIQNEEKVKKEFLSLWKDYKNNKIEKEKFLQISDEFARVLYEEKQMRKRFGKIIGPLHKKYEKICGLLDDLERVNNG